MSSARTSDPRCSHSSLKTKSPRFAEKHEQEWRQQELNRQRAQAILDFWMEQKLHAAAAERRLSCELDPYNTGIWD
jgi:hypothetical protein